MSASVIDLAARRAFRELELATIATRALTERKREETRLLEAETDRRRKLVDEFMEKLERLVWTEQQAGVFSPDGTSSGSAA